MPFQMFNVIDLDAGSQVSVSEDHLLQPAPTPHCRLNRVASKLYGVWAHSQKEAKRDQNLIWGNFGVRSELWMFLE